MGRITLGLLLALCLLAPAGPARAEDEPVSIGEIVADPDAYHFRLILMQGIVRRLTTLPPYSPATDTTCYGAYTFALEDETGAIEISVLGICGPPVLRTPEVREGERILLKAQVLSPNHMTSLTKGEVKKLRAIANEIRHVTAAEESSKPEGETGY